MGVRSFLIDIKVEMRQESQVFDPFSGDISHVTVRAVARKEGKS
jgi:hypothetical protein